MTSEQARSELEQIYGILSSDKQQALDVAFAAMERADDDIIAKVIAIIEFEDAWLEDAHRHNPDTRIAFDSMIKKIRAEHSDMVKEIAEKVTPQARIGKVK